MIVVEADAEAGEVALVVRLHIGDLLLGADAVLFGLEHDGRAVGVVGADIVGLVAAGALEAHPDIGLNVFDEMAEVDRAIGVGQGAGNEQATGHEQLR